MANLKEIKRRIQSVKNTQQITKAMKLVAASKLRKAQQAILEARPYAIKMMEVLNHLAARCNSDVHPLLDVREGNRHLLLIITSDKGLCGGFNGTIIRKTAQYLKDNDENENSLIVAGKKGNDIFGNRPVTIIEEHVGWTKDFDHLKAQAIGENLATMFSENKIDKVSMIYNEFKSVTISTLYEINNGLNGLENALQEMINEINKALIYGANIIILSDRGVSPDLAPIPMLLATSHTHHAFKRLKKRSKFGIIIESAEPREPHHFSLLFGYGASAINPYLVNEIISYQSKKDNLVESPEKAIDNFNKAIAKGIIKVMNKIGISTLHSYRGAQINEALGLSKKLIDKFFSNNSIHPYIMFFYWH